MDRLTCFRGTIDVVFASFAGPRAVVNGYRSRYSTGGPKWIPKEKGMVLVMGRGEDDLMEKTFDFYSDMADLYTVKCGLW
jgi:hypothetical protein